MTSTRNDVIVYVIVYVIIVVSTLSSAAQTRSVLLSRCDVHALVTGRLARNVSCSYLTYSTVCFSVFDRKTAPRKL